MKTIALRFGEHFAPPCGTIQAHIDMISAVGHVWYGKAGPAVSVDVAKAIMDQERKMILLIRSGKPERYWAVISVISRITPPLTEIPTYYRQRCSDFSTWFKVHSFIPARKDIMSLCSVCSSNAKLSDASQRSMSPYFIISCPDDALPLSEEEP